MTIVQHALGYTDPEVLESAAGFYIGQQYYDSDIGCHVPGGRLSVRYWRAKHEAQAALKSGAWQMRDHP